MTINNLWKILCYGVKRCHYEKLIGNRELWEQLYPDLFNNTFTTATGTQVKTLPDEVIDW